MRTNFLRAMLCIAFMTALLAFGGGATTATAQCGGCLDWWVEYDYIWPPCDTNNPVHVRVQWANGHFSDLSWKVDGHFIYPTPHPIGQALAVWVNGIAISYGTKVCVPYTCPPLMNMCLCVEWRCNPCLEIKIKLESCP